MAYYKIPEAFKAAHPLPEGLSWVDEDIYNWPSIKDKKHWLYYVSGHTPDVFKPGGQMYEIKHPEYASWEEALKYIYAMAILGEQ